MRLILKIALGIVLGVFMLFVLFAVALYFMPAV